MYLLEILQKYQARSIVNYSYSINQLKSVLRAWASFCYIDILESGSRAKGTAISLASDIDYLISLSNGCNQAKGGLEHTFNELYQHLINQGYQNVRKQNVSSRITLNNLEIDLTPASKQPGNTNDHSIWISKKNTWQKTNIQKHINDVSRSGRTNEIRLLKIWRELHKLDFPSIYLEYIIINNILLNKSSDINKLADNFYYVLTELAKDTGNPLTSKIVDPANSANTLSDLLTNIEKDIIINQAKESIQKQYWSNIVW